jgi:hypothetical protein
MRTWHDDEALPLIPPLINRLYRRHQRKIDHSEIVISLQMSLRGQKLIRRAVKLGNGERTGEQVASDIVAGFGQRFQKFGCHRQFKRDKPKGQNYRYWPVALRTGTNSRVSRARPKGPDVGSQPQLPFKSDIPTLITSASEIRAAYERLERRLKRGGKQFSSVVSWPSGQREATVWWHEKYRFWASLSPRTNRNYYLVAFGLQNPKQHNVLNIRCEVNPPRNGVNRRCGGVLVRDSKGNILLGHRGKVGGGQTGIGKTAFWKDYKGDKSRIRWAKGRKRGEDEVIILGRIDSPDILVSLAKFLLKVHSFKLGLNGPAPKSKKERQRSPSTFQDYKKALSYVLGSRERIVVPGHHNFQVRLNKFLTANGLSPEFERDFVDVQFAVNDERYIGEIKVTGLLNANQAFRVALGQLLEYAHLRFPTPGTNLR